jgi:hypothetical protein
MDLPEGEREKQTGAAIERPAGRGVPLVVTSARWAAGSAALAVALFVIDAMYHRFTHSPLRAESFARVGILSVLGALVLFGLLGAEESRLARELRTARTGTATLRGMALRRRQQLPFFMGLFSTRLGTAAVLLADGDRAAALEVLAAESRLMMRGGRLDALRYIVEADLERATGTSVGLERCVGRLRKAAAIGNREADLYGMHVVVKAVLEQGDAEAGLEIAQTLVRSVDDEQRVYAVWLRVWFDLNDPGDPWPPLTEGEMRMATLAARSHGAERLVEMLEERLGTIAQPRGRE